VSRLTEYLAAERLPRVSLTVVDGVPTCSECHARMTKGFMEGHTLVGYGRGECGRMHDDNCLSDLYTCPNGHRAVVFLRRSCECGWKGKQSCECHDGLKFETWP
jgi:hypothetical protein